MPRRLPKTPRTIPSRPSRLRRLIAAAVVAAALIPAGVALAAACPLEKKAIAACDRQLRQHDGTDVFALSPNQVLRLARDLGRTEPLLRRGFPRWSYAETRPLRLQLKKAARLGRIYSRAYRAEPNDESLPQEAAFENSLLDLERVARRAELPACSVRLAEI